MLAKARLFVFGAVCAFRLAGMTGMRPERVNGVRKRHQEHGDEAFTVQCEYRVVSRDSMLEPASPSDHTFFLCEGKGESYRLQANDVTIGLDSGAEYTLQIKRVAKEVDPEQTSSTLNGTRSYYEVVQRMPSDATPQAMKAQVMKAQVSASSVGKDRCDWEKVANAMFYKTTLCCDDLQTAKDFCSKDPKCDGVTDDPRNQYRYSFSTGSHTFPHPLGHQATAYICHDTTEYCADDALPLATGTDAAERCLGGNKLNRGYTYTYKGSNAGCKCFRQLATFGADPKKPKVMTTLAVLLNFTDYSVDDLGRPDDLMKEFYGNEGEGTFSDLIAKNSYGRLRAPLSAGFAMVANTGRSWASVFVPDWTDSRCPRTKNFNDLVKDMVKKSHPHLDLDSYDYWQVFLPPKARNGCPWDGEAERWCDGSYHGLPLRNSICWSYYWVKDLSTRAHELGHNFGLDHADAKNNGEMTEYFDRQAVMGGNPFLASYTAASRYKLGVLKEAQNEVFTPDLKRAVVLQSISLDRFDPKADYVAMMISCPECQPESSRYKNPHYKGGFLWVQFRGDTGYSSKLPVQYQSKVYVHLARNEGRVGGTELWATLSAGGSYVPPGLAIVILVCEIFSGDFARVSVAAEEDSAKEQCKTPAEKTPEKPKEPPAKANPKCDTAKCLSGSVFKDRHTEIICGGAVCSHGECCEACPSGHFSAAPNQEACTAWTKCEAGQRQTTPPNLKQNRVCEACAYGHFSAVPNQKACMAWTKCEAGQRQTTPPTRKQNRVCEACANGHFSAVLNQKACTAWTKCEAGQRQTTPLPTLKQDRVCENVCTCVNGMGATGQDCKTRGGEMCVKCNDGYKLRGGVCEANDKPNDEPKLPNHPFAAKLGTDRCPDGSVRIRHNFHCKSLGGQHGLPGYQGRSSWKMYPGGCFLHLGQLYFNTLSTGSVQRHSAPMCLPVKENTWQVAGVGCKFSSDSGGRCIESRNFGKENYGKNEECAIIIGGTVVLAKVDPANFKTERNYDKLKTSSGEFHGSPPVNLEQLRGKFSGEMVWSADGSVQNRGWKICRPEGSVTGGSAEEEHPPWKPRSHTVTLQAFHVVFAVAFSACWGILF